MGHDDIKDFKNPATLHPYENILTKTATAKELSVTGEKEKIKWSKLMQVRFSADNKDILSFKYKYNDIAFKTIHMVNFLGATRTRNRAAYFKESSLSNLYSAKPGIAKEKKQDLEKLCKKNLIPERYHSFYDSLEVTAGTSKKA